MSLANIEAGFSVTGAAANANAQIGAVKVTSNWLASNLVAGIENYGAERRRDRQQPELRRHHLIPDVPIPISKIASGIVAGSAAAGHHYGFVAHTIGAFKTAGFHRPCSPRSRWT